MSRIKASVVAIYPYLYMIALAVYILICNKLENVADVQNAGLIILLVLAVICNLYAVYAVVSTAAKAARSKTKAFLKNDEANAMISRSEAAFESDAARLTKSNMIIKLVHIPAYVFHFVLGLAGLVASVWGIGFIMWAVLIDLITIALTGTIGASAAVSCKREGVLDSKGCLKYAVLSYVYCVDVVCAVLLYRKNFSLIDFMAF